MSEAALTAEPKALRVRHRPGGRALARIARYSAVRLVSLALAVVAGVYLTILIANMGGYVDSIQRGEIRESVDQAVSLNPLYKSLPEEQRTALREEMYANLAHRYGLDRPFLLRSLIYLKDALTLDLGRALHMTSDSGSTLVRNILLERMPATLVLFGTSSVALFIVSVGIALTLSRRYGSILDKLFVMLAPTSAAPGWFFGIFLILFFAAMLHWLPFGHMVDAPPPADKFAYALSMLKHMILPMAAITLTTLPIQVYNFRTFFLIYSSEDYVEMAKAKGLKDRDVQRRYILRPTMPTILTGFALTVIGMWSGAPIFETVFQWPGFGRALISAINAFDTPVVVGEAVLYAYLLAATIFLLEFLYALVDPRVKIGGSGQTTG